jgi:hypothetical protein
VQVVALLNDGYSQDLWPDVVQASGDLVKAAEHRYAAALADDVYMPELVLYTSDPSKVYRLAQTQE